MLGIFGRGGGRRRVRRLWPGVEVVEARALLSGMAEFQVLGLGPAPPAPPALRSTTTTVAPSTGTVVLGQSITFRVEVTPTSTVGPAGTPSGQPTLVIDGASFPIVDLSPVSGTSHSASERSFVAFGSSELALGTHQVFAVFQGDTLFGSSRSEVARFEVVPPPASGQGLRVTGLLATMEPAGTLRIQVGLDRVPDAARASDLRNYVLRDRVTGKGVPLAEARFDPAYLAIVLRTSGAISPRHGYVLTIKGQRPLGLTDTVGAFLRGAGPRRPATNFRGVVMLAGRA